VRTLMLLVALGTAASAADQGDKKFDPAVAFGARPSVSDVSISPDGASIAFIAPSASRGAVLYTMRLDADSKPRPALTSEGKPFRLQGCDWVSNTRLVCSLYWVAKVYLDLAGFTRVIAVDSDGGNFKMLSTQQRPFTRGVQLGGGEIMDLLPDEDGVVLMTRVYIPESGGGSVSHIGSAQRGFGVDRIDTRTLQRTSVETPADVETYISDGRGNVRIKGVREFHSGTGQSGAVSTYLYRAEGSRDWHALSKYDFVERTGFRPVAVDPQLNGIQEKGRPHGPL
jgi:hypothetical protein